MQAPTLEQGHRCERTDKVPALAGKWGQIRGSENKCINGLRDECYDKGKQGQGVREGVCSERPVKEEKRPVTQSKEPFRQQEPTSCPLSLAISLPPKPVLIGWEKKQRESVSLSIWAPGGFELVL